MRNNITHQTSFLAKMEADDQNAKESTSEAGGTSSKPDNSESSTNGNSGEGTSSQVTNSAGAGPEEKTPSKRNYRRRTGQSENESSSDDDPAPAPAVNCPIADEAQPPQQQQPDEASGSEDVSLDELHVSNSDEGRDHNSGRCGNSETVTTSNKFLIFSF